MPGSDVGWEVTMNPELEREFGHVKDGQDRIEAHLHKQDTTLSDHFRKFNQHVLDDQKIQQNIEAHLVEHRENKKHRWAIVTGILLTAISTIGMLLVELVKHFWKW